MAFEIFSFYSDKILHFYRMISNKILFRNLMIFSVCEHWTDKDRTFDHAELTNGQCTCLLTPLLAHLYLSCLFLNFCKNPANIPYWLSACWMLHSKCPFSNPFVMFMMIAKRLWQTHTCIISCWRRCLDLHCHISIKRINWAPETRRVGCQMQGEQWRCEWRNENRVRIHLPVKYQLKQSLVTSHTHSHFSTSATFDWHTWYTSTHRFPLESSH